MPFLENINDQIDGRIIFSTLIQKQKENPDFLALANAGVSPTLNGIDLSRSDGKVMIRHQDVTQGGTEDIGEGDTDLAAVPYRTNAAPIVGSVRGLGISDLIRLQSSSLSAEVVAGVQSSLASWMGQRMIGFVKSAIAGSVQSIAANNAADLVHDVSGEAAAADSEFMGDGFKKVIDATQLVPEHAGTFTEAIVPASLWTQLRSEVATTQSTSGELTNVYNASRQLVAVVISGIRFWNFGSESARLEVQDGANRDILIPIFTRDAIKYAIKTMGYLPLERWRNPKAGIGKDEFYSRMIGAVSIAGMNFSGVLPDKKYTHSVTSIRTAGSWGLGLQDNEKEYSSCVVLRVKKAV